MKRKMIFQGIYRILKGIKDPISLITAVASVVIAVMSVIFTTKKSNEALARMDADIKASNKAVVLVSQKVDGDSIRLVLWNVGPGVAYNVKVTVHLIGHTGDVGAPWVSNLISTAIELGTKTVKERTNPTPFFYDYRYSINPPEILPPGKEYGYNTSRVYESTLSALYIEISYKDVVNNIYFSIWDGMNWKFSDQWAEDIFLYNTNQSLLSNYGGILDDALSANSIAKYKYDEWAEKQKQIPYREWLAKEAYLLKKKGFGDIPGNLKYSVQFVDTCQFEK